MDLSTVIEVPSKLERLFLHYFDTHFIADKGSAARSANFEKEMRLATRMAVASANTVYIPAASYYESDLCRKILSELDELVSYGVIVLLGSSVNLEEYLRERQDEAFYRAGSSQYNWYRTQHTLEDLPPYQRRGRSATQDVTDHWNRRVIDDSIARSLHDAVESLPAGLESRLERVPEELGKLAFVPEHVFEILDLNNAPALIRSRIRGVVNEGYFDSYVRDLNSGVMVDLRHLSCDFRMPSYGQNLSYIKMLRLLQDKSLLSEFLSCDPSKLGAYGNEMAWRVASQTSVAYIGAPAPSGLEPQLHTDSRVIMSIPAAVKQDEASLVSPTKVLCIAAAQVEYEVITQRLTTDFGAGKIVYLDDERDQHAVRYCDPKNGSHWFLASLAFQGGTEASGMVSHMFRSLVPDLTLMVGMCMGMPGRELPVGSVLVPNEVSGFDHRRLTEEGEQFRGHSMSADTSLFNVARLLTGFSRPYRVIADKGLASSSVKIEAADSALVGHIHKAFPDAIAFDMEGFGFYRGLRGNNKSLWVKGVADNGESQVGTTGGRDAKQVDQRRATENAIDFAIDVVRAWLDTEKA